MYNNINQLNTPYVPNVEGHVYGLEQVHRPYQTVNVVDDLYEYSQPVSITGVGSHQRFIENPFGTPAQISVLLLQCGDVGGTVQVAIDTSDITVFSGELPNGIPGIITTGQIQAVNIPYWYDFNTNVVVKTSGITTTYNVILGFRRLRDQYIPRNVNMMNELSE